MQAIVEIDPPANSTGDRQGWRQVEPEILDAGFRLTQRASKNEWTHGVLAVGDTRLALSNSDGIYGSSADGNSIFSVAGADGTQVRVSYPTADQRNDHGVIWRGVITSKAGKQLATSGVAAWLMRTPDASLAEARVNPGLVSGGQTIAQALERLFQDDEVAPFLPNVDLAGLVDPNAAAGGSVIIDETPLLEDTGEAMDVVERLLAAVDGIMCYKASTQQVFLTRRGAADARLAAGTLDSAIDVVAVSDGSEMVFNRVTAETGIDVKNQEEITREAAGSISQWGLRNLELDLSWITDLDKVERLARNLRDRLAEPHRVVELLVDGWALPPSSVFVGAQVDVQIPASAAIDAARYGQASYGGGRLYAQVDRPAVRGDFYIEEYSRDLANDTLRLRLRELQ